MERCYSSLSGSTGRPTILIFDRGLRDSLAFMTPDQWQQALAEANKELPGIRGRVDDSYVLERYDAVIHLVTAADGGMRRHACVHVSISPFD